MTYIIICTKCGRTERYNSQDEAVEKGCGGCDCKINNREIHIELCSKCYTVKTFDEEFDKQLPENFRK